MPFDGEVILGYSQWFVNCAHVNIVGPGGGTPGPMVRIPEVYKVCELEHLGFTILNQTLGG